MSPAAVRREERSPGRKRPVVIGLLALLALLALPAGCAFRHSAAWKPGEAATAAPRPGERMLRLEVINVGYGDCLLIRAPGGRTAMVDCGPLEAGPRVAEVLRRQGIESLDLLVITHPHPDHIDGLSSFIDQVKIRRMLHSGLTHEDSLQEDLFNRIRELGVPLVTAETSMEVKDLGDEVPMIVLHVGEFPENLNEASMVLRFSYGEHDFLLLADAEAAAEGLLLERYGPSGLHADVVKVGHHGNTSREDFIAAVSPTVALVSLGPNDYGAPDSRTLEAWRETGAVLYRTDVDGDISVVSDGRTLTVRTD